MRVAFKDTGFADSMIKTNTQAGQQAGQAGQGQAGQRQVRRGHEGSPDSSLRGAGQGRLDGKAALV